MKRHTPSGRSRRLVAGLAGAAEGEPVDVAEFSTVEVQRRDLAIEREAIGSVTATMVVEIDAPLKVRVVATTELGDAVHSGSVIARVDDRSVVVIEGDIQMWRSLAVGDIGSDVAQLEAAIVDLGFDPDGSVTIDDEYTDATAAMVRDWQVSVGNNDSGAVDQSDLVVLPQPMHVDAIVADVGSAVGAGDPIIALASDEQIVTAAIAVADAVTLTVGEQVALELPDRTELAGVVQSVGRGVNDAERSITVAFDDPGQVPAFGGVTVSIGWTTVVANDVLTLPADTLRHLERGVYVVDTIDGDGSVTSVEVTVGAAVGSFVEVSGLAEGVDVARP